MEKILREKGSLREIAVAGKGVVPEDRSRRCLGRDQPKKVDPFVMDIPRLNTRFFDHWFCVSSSTVALNFLRMVL